MTAREQALIRVRTLVAADIETESERLLVTLADEIESLTTQLQAAQAAIARVLNLIGDIGPEARRILTQLPADSLQAVKAAAWDEGHKTPWRRGPDDCRCEAWSSSECACGEFGRGELLSLGDNPFRAPVTPTENGEN